jgi:hypothetical protein
MNRLLLLLIGCMSAAASIIQAQPIDSILFVPHPRSDDQSHQSVQPGIEKINFENYDMLLLGGDLTYYTTQSTTTLDYLDDLFDLGSPNTLWTMGNHDMSHPEYVPDYTGRPLYYAYYIQHMTFLVLNTELDANGFVSSFISGDQLAMVQQVCDTITNSKYLILLQHRLLWMIGNDDLAYLIDSVGESTRQLDTSNFYQDIYPLLQQVKSKGIQILCLGGDKAKTNILYSPEDSITYFASTMGPEFSDTVNHVIIFTYHHENDSISWKFVRLKDVEEETPPPPPPVYLNPDPSSENLFISFDELSGEVIVQNENGPLGKASISIYDLSGCCLQTELADPGSAVYTCRLDGKGMFIVRVIAGSSVYSKKIVRW